MKLVFVWVMNGGRSCWSSWFSSMVFVWFVGVWALSAGLLVKQSFIPTSRLSFRFDWLDLAWQADNSSNQDQISPTSQWLEKDEIFEFQFPAEALCSFQFLLPIAIEIFFSLVPGRRSRGFKVHSRISQFWRLRTGPMMLHV